MQTCTVMLRRAACKYWELGEAFSTCKRRLFIPWNRITMVMDTHLLIASGVAQLIGVVLQRILGLYLLHCLHDDLVLLEFRGRVPNTPVRP